MTTVWPVTRTRGRFAPPPAAIAPVLPTRPVAVPLLPARVRATNGQTSPLPARRFPVPVQTAPALPATPLAAPTPAPAQPMPQGRGTRGAKVVAIDQPPAVKVAPTAIRDAAETRIRYLRGQIRQDCEALANSAKAIGKRIEAGETPRQDGEFAVIAHRLDQDCASLYELLRLTKCY